MAFFNQFPQVSYDFNRTGTIQQMVNIFRSVRGQSAVLNDSTLYKNYYIRDGMRPDIVSEKLYGTADFYWTFFVMNDNIRERGWPLSEQDLVKKAKKIFHDNVLTTRDSLTGKFKVGTNITGSGSGSTGKVIHRNLDLGQLVVETNDTFLNTEVIRDDNSTDTVTLVGSVEEFNSIAYYKNADGRIVDVDPYGTPNSQYTPVTQIEKYREENDKLKKIRVPLPAVVNDILISFQRELTNA